MYKDFSKSRHNVYVVCAGKVAKVTCELSKQGEEEEMMALYGEHPLDTIVGDRKKFTEQWKYSKLLEGHKGRHPHAVRLKHHKATILGYAQFDLSELVHGSQVVSSIEPLFMHFPFERQVYIIINRRRLTPFEEYLFEEHELQVFCTTLELSIRVGCLLNYGFDWDNGKFLKKYMTRAVIVCNTTTDMAQLVQFYKVKQTTESI
ncbi:uncharacterized protein LOC126834990 [Adelges cooleyi]|uniref:uncharacterized protein LOC126834990 n=1 Tax=Adelges cooleyi TaxID=133065 RepID=UPI0021805BD4|nr:uncharacterized protein LOC126834990 [Adelges cooleyi]